MDGHRYCRRPLNPSRKASKTMMDIAKKLQIKSGQTVFVGNSPEGFTLDLPEAASLTDSADGADAALVFVKDSSELETHAGPFIDAARRDALAYVAYPKAGQLGTDLNRDIIWRQLVKEGLRGVRQISIDGVWSAMRFRPG